MDKDGDGDSAVLEQDRETQVCMCTRFRTHTCIPPLEFMYGLISKLKNKDLGLPGQTLTPSLGRANAGWQPLLPGGGGTEEEWGCGEDTGGP